MREAPWQQPRFQFHIQQWPERPPQPWPPGHRPVQHYLWRCWLSLASSSHWQPCLLCLFCLAANILGDNSSILWDMCFFPHHFQQNLTYFTLVSRQPLNVDIFPICRVASVPLYPLAGPGSSFTSIHVFGLSGLPHNSSSRDFCRQPARSRAPRRRRAGRTSWTQLTLAFLLVRCGAMTSDLSHPTHLELI